MCSFRLVLSSRLNLNVFSFLLFIHIICHSLRGSKFFFQALVFNGGAGYSFFRFPHPSVSFLGWERPSWMEVLSIWKFYAHEIAFPERFLFFFYHKGKIESVMPINIIIYDVLCYFIIGYYFSELSARWYVLFVVAFDWKNEMEIMNFFFCAIHQILQFSDDFQENWINEFSSFINFIWKWSSLKLFTQKWIITTSSHIYIFFAYTFFLSKSSWDRIDKQRNDRFFSFMQIIRFN